MAARDDAPPGAGEATTARERGAAPSEASSRSRVVLMAVDPFHVHVYWEVTPEDRVHAHEQLDPQGRREPPLWVLRFHDVTCVEFDGENAHGHFDVPVDLAANNWYVELWSSDKTYFVELGPRSGAGFVAACRSNFEQVPRAEPSSRYEPKWHFVVAAPRAAPDDPHGDAAPEPAPGAAEQEAEAGTPATTHATGEPSVAPCPMPAFACSGRSLSVSLEGGSGSGSAGGSAR